MGWGIDEYIKELWERWHAEDKHNPACDRQQWMYEAVQISIAIERKIELLQEKRGQLINAVHYTMRDIAEDRN